MGPRPRISAKISLRSSSRGLGVRDTPALCRASSNLRPAVRSADSPDAPTSDHDATWSITYCRLRTSDGEERGFPFVVLF